MSTKHTYEFENTDLATSQYKMLVHQPHPKGSDEHKGIKWALGLSVAIVLLSGLALSACKQTPSSLSMKDNSAVASAVSLESQRARESSYIQHKELGTIFAQAMDPL